MNNKKIIAISVYLQKRKTREYVGKLEKKGKKFVFSYDNNYLYKGSAISLGPDLPVGKTEFIAGFLWESFLDRLPSKQNPAYPEYCAMVGISPSEKDPLVLLSTLGQKGPSSFIFTPIYQEDFHTEDLVKFRKKLQLSYREFSELFDFAPSTINKIEKNKGSGKDAMKRLEIYYLFPEVALYEVRKNGGKISDEKREYVEKILKGTIERKF